MNLDQIQAFIYVSLTKSFRKTGEILYISQPTVSARIKSLEEELGFRLFDRNSKTLSLTNEGDLFLPYAERGVEEIQAGLIAARKKVEKAKGELNISVVLTMSNYILPILLKKFHQKCPNVKLTIHSGHTHNVLDMVLNHQVPLGIVRSVSHPDIKNIQLVEDELVLATYPGHSFSKRRNVYLKEIINESLILFNRGTMDWAIINNAFKKHNLKPNVILEADNIELVKQMIKRKMGMGILPKSSIEDETMIDDFCIVKINDLPQLNRPFQLIYLKDTELDGLSGVFVEFMIEQIPDIVNMSKQGDI